jgi:hypothetical protein
MSYLDTRISRRTVLAGTAVAGAATFAGARVFGLAVMAQDEPEAYEAPRTSVTSKRPSNPMDPPPSVR